MQLDEVVIPRAEARQAAVDYRRQSRLEQDPVARRELEEMARTRTARALRTSSRGVN